MIRRLANTLKAVLNILQHRLVKLQPLCQAAAKALLRQGFSSSELHHKSGYAKSWQCGCR